MEAERARPRCCKRDSRLGVASVVVEPASGQERQALTQCVETPARTISCLSIIMVDDVGMLSSAVKQGGGYLGQQCYRRDVGEGHCDAGVRPRIGMA